MEELFDSDLLGFLIDDLLQSEAEVMEDIKGPIAEPIVAKPKPIKATKKVKFSDPLDSASLKIVVTAAAKKQRIEPLFVSNITNGEPSLWESYALANEVISRLWAPSVEQIKSGNPFPKDLKCPCGASASLILESVLTNPDKVNSHCLMRGLGGILAAANREIQMRGIANDKQEIIENGEKKTYCYVCQLRSESHK
jgi:hypothetical protein